MNDSARPPRDSSVETPEDAVALREETGRWRSAVLRWGAPLIYLVAIGVLYVNSSPIDFMVTWQWVVQLTLIPLVIAAVVFRVRFPYALALLGIVAITTGTLSVFLVGMMSLAVRRGGVRPWLVAGVGTAAALVLVVQRDLARGYSPGEMAIGVVVITLVVGIAPGLVGNYIRVHRRLEASVAERAVRAEFERERAANEAVHAERERIARDMHDSLGHVLALVTMQAGALEVQSKDPQTVAAAEQIRASARKGLADLRAVVRALGEDTRRDPAPDLAAVPRLIQASRDAGAVVEIQDGLSEADRSALSPAIGRVLYHVTQEALTNAHRHAPSAPVAVTLTGRPGSGIELGVRNRLAPGGERGAGTGIASLRNRVEVLGGQLGARATHGHYELRVWLPWEAT